MTLEKANELRRFLGLPASDDANVITDTEADAAFLALPAFERARRVAPWESLDRRVRESLRRC